MTLLVVPNISEGRDTDAVRRIARAAPGTTILDVHTDPHHNRAVVTLLGEGDALPDACASLVECAIEELDLGPHEGVHPRFGTVDVLPFVVHRAPADEVVAVADATTERIGALGVPVHRYGIGARPLPELRRLLGTDPPAPEAGPAEPHPRAGRICLGVRGPLLAFNVNLRGPLDAARLVTRTLRAPDVQALTFPVGDLVQVSMNLLDPLRTGPRAVFARVAELASGTGLEIVDAEVVGLLPDEIADQTSDLPMRRRARSVAEAAIDASR